MLGRRDDAFPFEAVRDLLGVVRALYAAEKVRGASRGELARLAAIGRDLALAIDLAATTREATVGQRAAWQRAEDATRRLSEVVDALTPAEPLVSAARGRVTGARGQPKKKRHER